MPQELIQLNTRRTATRVILILLLIAVCCWSYFVFRWYLGNTLAEYFNTTENSIDMAQMARTLAPNDPLPHWRLAQVYQQKLTLDQSQQIIAEYEKAVSLSPNDYRFWMSLGTALEQAGEPSKGEVALRQAVALAPSYSYPRWYLGNLLLRSGRYDEAFSDLRLASDADPELRPQFFRLLREIYDSDIANQIKAVGETPTVKAEFALYLAGQKQVDDALKVWNSLSESDKKTNASTGYSIINSLVGLHRFYDAMTVWNVLSPSEPLKAEVGRVTDGGFEDTVSHSKDTVFGWQVGSAAQTQIGIDPQQAHNGTRSLRLVFQVRKQLDSLNVSQLVLVVPGAEYDFECYVRTEKLQSGNTPFVQILDAADGSVLATSAEAPTGDNDWTRVSLSFKTGDKAQAIKVVLARAACEEDKICPIFGAIWYDDFSVKRRG